MAGLAAVAGLAVVLAPEAEQTSAGRDGATLAAQREVPAVEAYFLRESYRPGSRATLVVTTNVRAVTVQVFRTGDAPIAGKRRAASTTRSCALPTEGSAMRRSCWRLHGSARNALPW